MIKRREFIAGLGSTAAWPVAVRAQQSDRMRRIGVLMLYGPDDPAGLKERGIPTPRGGSWSAVRVARLLDRVDPFAPNTAASA